MDRNNTGTLPLTNESRKTPSSCESQASLSVPEDQRTAPGGGPVPVLTSSAPSAFETNMSYVNETVNTSPQCELRYSVPNARPPGTVVNRAYEPDTNYDVKYADPPSYDEAIKAMHYRPPEEPDHTRYHRYPDQGQFSTSEPIFYHQSCNNELETELAKSFCPRVILAIIIFAFAACTIRVLYYVT